MADDPVDHGAGEWRKMERKTYPQAMALRAAEFPDKIFLRDAVTGEAWSYRTVHDEGLRWAAAYGRQDVKAGDRVLAMMSTRIEYFLSCLGLSWARAVNVPVNAELRGPLLAHVIRVASAAVALIEDRFVDLFLSVIADVPVPRLVVIAPTAPGYQAPRIPGTRVMLLEEFLEGARAEAAPEPPAFHHLAGVHFTSGTTGPSKGVQQPWGQLYRTATTSWQIDDMTPDDAVLVGTASFHLAATLFPYMLALVGGTLVFRDRFSPSNFLSDVRKYRCTHALTLGAMAHFLMRQEPRADDGDTSLHTVLMVAVPPNVDDFKRRFKTRVITCYGMTEICPPCSSEGYDVNNETASSCGRANNGLETRIVDDNDYEVAPGEVGELIVRADEPWALNAGYLGMPEATAAAWRNGWFHTGDAFRVDEDGFFYFVDRIKDAIRRRGENISSMEVESLVNTHPEIAGAAAIAAPSDDVEDEVKVCIVRTPGSNLTHEALIDFLTPVMPPHMLPRYVEFMEEFPKTPTERVKKAELRARGMTSSTWDRQRGRFVGAERPTMRAAADQLDKEEQL